MKYRPNPPSIVLESFRSEAYEKHEARDYAPGNRVEFGSLNVDQYDALLRAGRLLPVDHRDAVYFKRDVPFADGLAAMRAARLAATESGPYIAMAVISAGNGVSFQPGDQIPRGTFSAAQAEPLERGGYLLACSNIEARHFKPGVKFEDGLRAMQAARRQAAGSA